MYSRLSFRLESFAPFLPAFSGLKSWLASTVLLTQSDARPDQTLCQVLHTASVPEAFRLRLAEVGVLTNDVMANLGESPQAFVQNIKALLTGDNPFGEAPQSIIVEAKLVSSWRKSRALMEETDSKRSKLMEDPHMIPEIPIHEYSSYRANFVARHPDVLVVDVEGLHKKFLERLIRDLTWERSAYLARMWSRSPASPPRQKCCSRFARRRCPQASQRRTALSTAYMRSSWPSSMSTWCPMPNTSETAIPTLAAPLDYLAELERRRRDTPGLQFLLLADERMRREVCQLTTEMKERISFVLGRTTWCDEGACRDMVRVQDGRLERSGPQSSPGRSFQAAGQDPRNEAHSECESPCRG